MKAPLYSKDGSQQGDFELNPEIYAARINPRLLELVKNAYAANLRHGTVATKTRKDVRGGGKKPWKQKGTGRARASSIRSPLWRGGGTVFGPQPRDYFVNLPSSMRRSALIAALSQKAKASQIMLMEAVAVANPKTKEFVALMKAMPLNNRRTLCVVAECEPALKRASQNVKSRVEVRKASDINAFHVLQREKLIIEKGALKVLEARLLSKDTKKQG